VKTVGGLEYGRFPHWEIELPDGAFVVDPLPPERVPPPLDDVGAAVLRAVREPLGMKPLAEQVGPGDTVTIAINDWMSIGAEGVPPVLAELARAGVDERDVRIVVAGGIHQRLTRGELYQTKVGQALRLPYPSVFHILPPEVIDRFWPTSYSTSRIRMHDAADEEHLVTLGTTDRGNLVEVNDCLTTSNLVIYLSGFSGVPSIWGGYLGGGQSIAVGLGSARSIMSHHTYRVHQHPDSMHSDARTQLFMQHKQSVAAFVDEAVGRKTCYVEGYLNSHRKFSAVVAGEGAAVREPIFSFADDEKIYEIPEPVDVFVSGGALWGAPYDTVDNPLIALVQLNNRIREYVGGEPPLREGGVAILITPCDGTVSERSRPADRELTRLWASLGHDLTALEDYEEEYAHREDLIAKYRWAHGSHPLHPFPLLYENAFLLSRARKIIFAGARSPEAAALVGATAVPTWDDAWRLACRTLGKTNPSVMVTPRVGTRTPYLWRVAG
jgi:hypothetical protein